MRDRKDPRATGELSPARGLGLVPAGRTGGTRDRNKVDHSQDRSSLQEKVLHWAGFVPGLVFLWIQEQRFLTDRLSAFDRRRRRVAVANQRAGVTLNNRVGVGGPAILEGVEEK